MKILFFKISMFTSIFFIGVIFSPLSSNGGWVLLAETKGVEFLDYGFESHFPEGVRFFATVESPHIITDIKVIFEVGDRKITQYNYLNIDKNPSHYVTGDLFLKTNSPDRYIPPGSNIKFFFEAISNDEIIASTEKEEVILIDSRFDWEFVAQGPIKVYFHGPVKSRAETLAEKCSLALSLMQPVTGADLKTPITVMLYNNYAEMIDAVVPKSKTISRELITEGQAFDDENTVLVLAGRSDIGTATHEITHILVGRASNGASLVPFWLNEGLAEFGNQNQTISYTRYLEWAIGTARLPSWKFLNRSPSDPNMMLVGYGVGRSAVEFLVQEYGPGEMARLLTSLGSGLTIDSAMLTVYGISMADMENLWRSSIGADEYKPPTPIPVTEESVTQKTENKPILPMTLDDMKKAGRDGKAEELNSISVTPIQKSTPISNTSSLAPEVDDDSNQQLSCNILNRSGPTQSIHLVGFILLIIVWLNRMVNRITGFNLSRRFNRGHFSTSLALANSLFSVPPKMNSRSEDVTNEQCDRKDSIDCR